LKKLFKIFFLAIFCVTVISTAGLAQTSTKLDTVKIRVIGPDSTGWYMKRFDDLHWDSDGFTDRVELDGRQTNEIRARLQKVYGEPTRTLEDNIRLFGLNVNTAIQFEYWFVVNDSIPLMVIDVGGPFFEGLAYSIARGHRGQMHEIKKVLSDKLMSLGRDELANYADYYYSINHRQWYLVTHKDGLYRTNEISRPPSL